MSLEDEFWQAFTDIARKRGMAVNELAAEIDAERGMESGLASAIRVFVLRALTGSAPGAPGNHPGPPHGPGAPGQG